MDRKYLLFIVIIICLVLVTSYWNFYLTSFHTFSEGACGGLGFIGVLLTLAGFAAIYSAEDIL